MKPHSNSLMTTPPLNPAKKMFKRKGGGMIKAVKKAHKLTNVTLA